MSWLILVAQLALAEPSAPVFSGEPALSVLVVDRNGNPIAGATLLLCPLAGLEAEALVSPLTRTSDCVGLVADGGGRAAFRNLPEAAYSLVASLEGYSHTALFPLPVGRSSPVAAEEVVVLLEPLCFDCVAIGDPSGPRRAPTSTVRPGPTGRQGAWRGPR